MNDSWQKELSFSVGLRRNLGISRNQNHQNQTSAAKHPNVIPLQLVNQAERLRKWLPLFEDIGFLKNEALVDCTVVGVVCALDVSNLLNGHMLNSSHLNSNLPPACLRVKTTATATSTLIHLPYPHLTPHINETMRQWLNMRDTDTSPVALKLPFHLQIMRMLCMI